MVLADFQATMSTIAQIVAALSPIALVILTILLRRGIVNKEQKQEAEEVIRVLADSIEVFKGEDKPASKSLTELIEAKAEGAKVGDKLKGYLDRYGLNNGKK